MFGAAYDGELATLIAREVGHAVAGHQREQYFDHGRLLCH